MKKAVKLQINSPCKQSWQAMSQAEKGRFCQNCQKTVIDFSTWSEEKIKDFFLEHRGGVCGRFQEGQLKIYAQQDPLWSYSPSFYTAAVASLLGMSTLTDSAAQASSPSPVPSYQTAAGKDSCHQVRDTFPRDSLPPYQIKGRVVDGKEALTGVNVILKGTTIGTTTDANGEFTLLLNELPTKQTTLIFSYIGYESLEKEVKWEEAFIIHLERVNMEADVTVLGEVVCINPVSSLWWKIKSLFR